MIVGFNHNIRYRGISFHVQTEDSGVKKPQLVTLLYQGGTIISSQKTVYADILKVDNLSLVVEDLAKEQHKGMLRRLTRGEFDQRIVELGIPLGPPPVTVKTFEDVPAETLAAPVAAAAAPAELPEATPVQAPVAAEPLQIIEQPIVDKFRQAQPARDPEQSLDALIYAYLSGADEL